MEQTINDAKVKGVVGDISKEVRDFIRKFVMFQRLEFDRAESAVNFRSRRNKKDRKLSEVRILIIKQIKGRKFENRTHYYIVKKS